MRLVIKNFFLEEGNINNDRDDDHPLSDHEAEGESVADPDPDLVVIGEKKIPPVLTLNKLKGESGIY